MELNKNSNSSKLLGRVICIENVPVNSLSEKSSLWISVKGIGLTWSDNKLVRGLYSWQ